MDRRAVTYARVSGDDRGNDRRNLTGQLEMGREYCAKRGYEIVAELAEDDRGASGASFELEQLKRIREMAQEREFDVLVVRELDRLSRNLAKQLIVEEELLRCGVAIEYVLGEYPDTPEGKMMKQFRGAIAEFEREKIKERYMRGKRLKVKAGSVMISGSAPYGYKVEEVNKKWVFRVYESEAQIVRMIYDWYVHGDETGKRFGILGITNKLSGLRIPTRFDKGESTGKPKRRGQGEWCPAQVAQILKNETYRGVWHFGKRGSNGKGHGIELIPVNVPAIVDDEMWYAAQERRRLNKGSGRRGRKHQYLLSGRAGCGHCGAKASSASNSDKDRSYQYYRCNSDRGYSIHKGCNLPMFRADHVDRLVWDWVSNLLRDPGSLEEGLQTEQAEREKLNAPLMERLHIVEELLIENRMQLQRLLDLYLMGEFDKGMLVDRKERLETTIKGLERERVNLDAAIQSRLLSYDQIGSIKRFTERIAAGILAAGDNFKVRHEIVEALDVTVTLAIEHGEKILYANCILGEETFYVTNIITQHDS